MLKNYFTLTLRRLRKHPGYTAINVVGLAVGMACCVLMLLFVHDELSYDRYHENSDRVHRVTRSWINEAGETSLHLARVAAPISPLLAEEFPEVEASTRIWGGYGFLMSRDELYVEEDNVYFVEEAFFDLFTTPFVQGDPATALTEPFTMVLTESTARRYFGEADAMHQTLTLDGDDYRVTGVVEDPPLNTHFRYDALGSFATLIASFSESRWSHWGFNNYASYVLLHEGADAEALEAKLPGFLNTHYKADASQETQLHLQPLPSIHLHSHLDTELGPNGDIAYVYLFSAVALLVLLVACFNFMNLATARASRRAKEVGVRKVLGAQRGQLMRQFFGEALVLALLALVGALFLVEATLPLFNDFAGKELNLFGEHAALGLLILVGITLFVGVVAGSYPAFFLSRFQPVRVLKTAVAAGSWRSRFRTVLVVSQFGIAVLLIIGVFAIVQQLNYVQQKQLGFDEAQLVTLPLGTTLAQDFDNERNKLVAHPGVLSMTASKFVPSNALLDNIDGAAEVEGTMREYREMPLVPVDHDFVSTYGMQLVAGRDFSKERASDSTEAVLLNEAAVARVGWASPEAAIGKTFTMEGNANNRRATVIGVVSDFHFESLHERIAPMILFIQPAPGFYQATIRISGDRIPETLAFLEAQWAVYRPNMPFAPAFVDAQFDALYRSEARMGQVLGLFALLAVLIACLGLFGLASFVAQQRTKEIGVRKVLGASVGNVILLLSKDFAVLVLVGFVVAAPLAYFAVQRWLADFAYHIELGAPPFLLTGLGILTIALLTVSFQSIRAALADPVKSLRYE